jgi:hypothetical protein
MSTANTIIGYYLMFWHGNPFAAIFIHGVLLIFLVAIIHDWITEYHVHTFCWSESTIQRDINTNLPTHLRCTHKGCLVWCAVEDLHVVGKV